MRVVCLYFQKATELESIAEACLKWSPQITVRNQEAIFIEISQCQSIYKEKTVLNQLRWICNKFQKNPIIEVANDPSTALSFCLFKKRHKSELPIQSLLYFASPFEREFSFKKETELMVESLKKLGIYTLGSFLKLPHETLTSRFSVYGSFIRQNIKNGQNLPWPRLRARTEILENFHFDQSFSLTEIEPVYFRIRPLIEKIILRLRGKALLLSSMELKLEMERYSNSNESSRAWVFHFPKPQSDMGNILKIMMERLNISFSKHPLSAPPKQIQLKVLESLPRLNLQRDLFQQKQDTSRESFDALLARLSERLGRNLFSYQALESYLPGENFIRLEGAVLESIQNHQKKQEILSEQPMRIFKEPFQLFSLSEGQRVSSPERIETGWWEKEIKRDYYRVLSKENEKFLVFKDTLDQNFYLHGIYD